MTFRVEPELRTSFAEAAERDHQPAAQVLRKLMRAYVEQSKRNASPASAVNAADRSHREQAVRYARASIGLEGFSISPAEEAHARRFIEGEIDLAEFVAAPRGGSASER